MRDRDILTIRTDWRGIAIRIGYEANRLSMPELRIAHVTVESIAPKRAPLPFTETGYKSHYTSPEAVEDMGGPLAYVLAWLDAEARAPKWKAGEVARAQLSLF